MSATNKNVPDEKSLAQCCTGVREVLSFVGDKWSVLIVVVLADGSHRFNELHNKIDGISQRMLTRTLRGLERNGLVTRTVMSTVPPSVYYELTKLGSTLLDPVTALTHWARTAHGDIKIAQDKFDQLHPDKD